MEELNPKEIACLGTVIAMEMVRGKDKDEIKRIKALVHQINCTLHTLSHNL